MRINVVASWTGVPVPMQTTRTYGRFTPRSRRCHQHRSRTGRNEIGFRELTGERANETRCPSRGSRERSEREAARAKLSRGPRERSECGFSESKIRAALERAGAFVLRFRYPSLTARHTTPCHW